MRAEFARWAERTGQSDSKMIFFSGDLGFNAFEKIVASLGPRYINAGVAEQNMISVAAGLAKGGLHPLVYSIAPFAIFRGAEQLRLDCSIHGMRVKVVGNGGGYHYGIQGASHHALEDIAFVSALPNTSVFVPFCVEDVELACEAMWRASGTAYLRLGGGRKPEDLRLSPFAPIRRVVSGSGVTIAGIGPVLLNALQAAKEAGVSADVFSVGQIPLADLTTEFTESVSSSRKLLIVEEHVERGGVGEHLVKRLVEAGVGFSLSHVFAKGYPSGLSGSQEFHRRESGLDVESLLVRLKQFTG